MESLRYLLLIGLFGALGAMSRYGISLGMTRWLGGNFPYGTLAVNLIGCFLLGLLAGVVGLAASKPEAWFTLPVHLRDALAIGFLGALTTFSTFSLETVRLLARHAYLAALTNMGTSLVCGLLAVYGGMILSQWMFGSEVG